MLHFTLVKTRRRAISALAAVVAAATMIGTAAHRRMVVERRPGFRQPEPLLLDHLHRRQPLLGGR
ncbi:MAG: hypothetical protein ACXVHQ_37810 [Solirubrobacteraceae bacterium]